MLCPRGGRPWLWAWLAMAGPAHAAPGFLVVAPDRGFTGNEMVRDAFAPFAAAHPAELVFVTSEGTARRLDQALAAVSRKNAKPVIVLPFYLSTAHPDMDRIEGWLEDSEVLPGRPFGRSAAAPAALRDRLLAIDAPAQTHLVLVGHGAETAAQVEKMQRDLYQVLTMAAGGQAFGSTEAVLWPDVDALDEDDIHRRLADLESKARPVRSVVLPFHLGPDLDSMMGFTPRLQSAAPEDIDVLDSGAELKPAMSRWLAREAARYQKLAAEEIGVVVHAHGASWEWNETMRLAAAPLAGEFLVEYAFSMGDPATLEHAVRHLEERGARAIVIVRVFGMASSFREGILRFIGDAWENCAETAPALHGHDHAAGTTSAPLLWTRLPVVSVGGLENHPLFAKALYQRALDLAEQPARETVILVAHGLGEEAGNAHWRKVLESIREQMLGMGGNEFRRIDVALWSEDWPELRQDAVEHVRGLVQEGNEDNGRVLIIPARTLGQGPADEYLEGLNYVLGEGFAPHPLFTEWLRVQVRAGMEQLSYGTRTPWNCAAD